MLHRPHDISFGAGGIEELGRRLGEAQHVINLAAGDGHFDQFMNEKNGRQVWAEIKRSALELLAGQYPELDVRIVPCPGSNEVTLKVTVRRP